jgi:UDP-N-acetylglucosamine--N-acetylmuramyl-(pentapeptide) pyrophosphoryl-undecaprenol N-acetylglucosamine transferase
MGFSEPRPDRAIDKLGLDSKKKILLVTGASSGSQSINTAVCSLLDNISAYADDWQIVHLTGTVNLAAVEEKYSQAGIAHKVIGYFDEMADLLSAADLVIGRSGAVSVAEYAAAGVASICMPYPHHKDRHQYFNAEVLVNAGAAVVVDDLPEEKDRSECLWEQLEELIKDDAKRSEMSDNCKAVAQIDAASVIAERVLSIA